MDLEPAIYAAYFIGLTSIFGLYFLMSAVDGRGPHVGTLDGRLTVRQRVFALAGAGIVVLLPFVGALFVLHVTPTELWDATLIMWGHGMIGKAFAMSNWVVMTTPLMALVAGIMIRRDQKRQQRKITAILAS